jgi:hypothetical protein
MVFLGPRVKQASSQSTRAFYEYLPPDSSLSPEYADLISERYRGRINSVYTLRSKIRNPISFISLSDQFRIMIYKIPLKRDVSFINNVKTLKGGSGMTVMVTYLVMESQMFKLRYAQGEVGSVSGLFLNLDGEDISPLVRNDSCIYYRLSCKNLSLRYGQNGPVDLFIENTGRAFDRYFPLEVLLMKRNQAAFLMLMTPANITIHKPVLYNLVRGENY